MRKVLKFMLFIPLLFVITALALGPAAATTNVMDTQTPAVVAIATNTTVDIQTVMGAAKDIFGATAIETYICADSTWAPGVPAPAAWKKNGRGHFTLTVLITVNPTRTAEVPIVVAWKNGERSPNATRADNGYVLNSVRDIKMAITTSTTLDVRGTAAAILTAAGHTSRFHRTHIQV